ncbi:OsmC family protein [Pseudovibrio sp. POLY-S9]|uniref:OsmC family protein n=1 Tax=Pseudovibrio sp. POLY-S9 TaxID=1576596 RepID=UPI0007089AD3|nr:OsmC family protein [Pseudovibrio sp. POLY-S9]
MLDNNTVTHPIVTRAAAMPTPQHISLNKIKKSKDGMELEVDFLAELTGDGLVKTGVVQPNVPGFGAFEVLCDEGSSIGGSDTAPAPLSYLAAGIGFCLLTHVHGLAQSRKLNISSIKLEQKMKFQSRIPGMTAEEGSDMLGVSKGVETVIIIESQEDPSLIASLVEASEKACMALQTVVNAVPASTTIINNGQKL